MNINIMEKNLKRIKLVIILELAIIPIIVIFPILTFAFFIPAFTNPAAFVTGIILAATLFALFTLTLLILSIITLILRIFILIYSFEFEDKIYAILFILGFFIGLVGLIGSFLFYDYLKKQIDITKATENNTMNSAVDAEVSE